MTEFETAKAAYEAAEARARSLDTSAELIEARKAAHAAYAVFSRARELQWGKDIVDRLVGQTIVAVNDRWSSPCGPVVAADETELDDHYDLVLSNGVRISATGREGGERLEISFPRELPPSINAVDPVPGVVAEVRRAPDDSSFLPSLNDGSKGQPVDTTALLGAPHPARTEE